MAPLYMFLDQPIALQPDGKLIVATELRAAASRFRVVRLDTDGAIDPFFQEGAFNNSVWSLFIQSDGRVLAGGDFTIANGVATTFVARLLADPIPAPPTLRIQSGALKLSLRWLGCGLTLESAPSVTAPFTALPQATSPYIAAAGKTQEFFRLSKKPATQPAASSANTEEPFGLK